MKLFWSIVLLNALVVATCLICTKGQAISQELPDASALRETAPETLSNVPVAGGLRVSHRSTDRPAHDEARRRDSDAAFSGGGERDEHLSPRAGGSAEPAGARRRLQQPAGPFSELPRRDGR